MLIVEGMSHPDTVKEAVCLLKPLFDMICKVLKVQWVVLKEGESSSLLSDV